MLGDLAGCVPTSTLETFLHLLLVDGCVQQRTDMSIRLLKNVIIMSMYFRGSMELQKAAYCLRIAYTLLKKHKFYIPMSLTRLLYGCFAVATENKLLWINKAEATNVGDREYSHHMLVLLLHVMFVLTLQAPLNMGTNEQLFSKLLQLLDEVDQNYDVNSPMYAEKDVYVSGYRAIVHGFMRNIEISRWWADHTLHAVTEKHAQDINHNLGFTVITCFHILGEISQQPYMNAWKIYNEALSLPKLFMVLKSVEAVFPMKSSKPLELEESKSETSRESSPAASPQEVASPQEFIFSDFFSESLELSTTNDFFHFSD